ncbi:MAG: RsmE family RNA methyltransferase [Roseiflexaceae bacterium]
MPKIANTFRFFLPHDVIHAGGTSDADIVHQWGRVLRIQPGQRLLLLDGHGVGFEVDITHIDKKHARWIIVATQSLAGEPNLHVTLASAIIRSERFEWLLQKATEIGVSRFVPMIAERSRGEIESVKGKHERWQRIIREAAEQSCRAVLPELTDPVTLRSLQLPIDATCLWLHEGSGTQPLRQQLQQVQRTIWIVTGPEGGFSDDETVWMTQQPRWHASGLGQRILRAETAPLVAATIALATHGEFDGA